MKRLNVFASIASYPFWAHTTAGCPKKIELVLILSFSKNKKLLSQNLKPKKCLTRQLSPDKGHPRSSQEAHGKITGSPQEASRKPQGSSKETPRKPQGNPQETTRKQPGNPQVTPRKLPGSH